MSEDIQTQPNEGNENDNSSESSPEEITTDPNQSQEGQNSGADNKGGKGFADDPRWQERENDWKTRFNDQETRHTTELQRLREDFDVRLEKIGQAAPKNPTKIPAWFNGDEDQWAQFNEYNKSLVDQARSEALKEIESRSAADQKSIDDATKYFVESITSIESDKTLNPQNEKIDRNKLLKFVLDNDLVDSKGRWNYKAGYMMMKGNPTKPNTQDRKKLAGATTSDNQGEEKPSEFATSEDFKKPGARPW